VSGVDLFATVLDLLGVAEVGGSEPIDSVSLLPYLRNPEQDILRDWSYSEQFNGEARPEEDGRAIRDPEYKYIRFSDGREAFFDLTRDRYEARDLWGQRLSLTEQARLSQLQNWMDALLRGDEVGPAVSLYLPILSPVFRGGG
jgi:arylsulfatase A-like enzyme